ncbi:ribonuclease H-like domain-containing protein [Tanacetum coccineum]
MVTTVAYLQQFSPLPKSPSVALSDPRWRDAMYDEYNALIKNDTWILVPKPPNVNVVRSMWLFRHKYHVDGSLSSPVVKPATIRTVLSLALARNWHVHQLDVKYVFLNGDLTETVYIYQPPGFVDSRFPHHHGTEIWGLLIISLERAHILNWNSTRTMVGTESKLGSDGDLVSDSTLYRSLSGGFQYLTFTRPDISYVVQQICLYIHNPRESHLAALKRVLHYVRGTLDHGLKLHVSSTSQLKAYTHADCGRVTLSRSSAEAEYHGVANVVAETAWIRNLLRELHTPLFTATLVYCDNVSAVYMSTNPVQHQRTKHIEIHIHFVRDMVARGQVHVLHVPSRYQYADIFTKGLPTALFEEFRTSLSVRSSPAQTAGEC